MSEQEQSSEVKDQEAEKSAAEEALEATAGPASETEKTVPLHAHTALRERAQKAELDAANLRGQLSVMTETAKVAEPEKSPIVLAAEEQGKPIDEILVDGKLLREQQAWDKRQDEQVTTVQAKQEVTRKQGVSTKAAMGKHADFLEVAEAGFALMTEGQKVDINNETENFGEVLYATAQKVIADNADPESKTETAPEKKQSESEAEEKKKEETEKVPTQDEILAESNADPDTLRAAQL